MAKAKPEATTARIRLSRAIELAGEYLGDPEYAEREIRKGLADGEIPCQYARFEAPQQYSGPRPDDPEFWKFGGQLRTRDGSAVIVTWRDIHIEGDSAVRTDDVAAYGIELGRSALVRLKLLPADALRAASPARKKRKEPQVERARRVLQKRYPPDGHPPGEILTETLKQEVQVDLESEGVSSGFPSWDSVARAAGRKP